MKKFQLLAATAMVMAPATAWAQSVPPASSPTPSTVTDQTTTTQGPQNGSTTPPDNAASTDASQTDASQQGGIQDIVVTAQRQSEVLQNVPIAVTAFNAAALQAQQINTTSDLQLTLPNITFSKGNFTSSASFNIRGIGDLCVGVTCDAATAIHVNDVPIIASPIFQNEYFDLERIEVLRGPQGTLFGRNATGGVVNFITAKPDLSGIHASGDVEYGNFDSIRVKGMFNLPLTDTIGVRLAGYYLNRNGFTHNNFTNSQIDGRNQFDVRASIRWQPTPNTTFDIVGHYFREDDDRSRIQKQLCHRDPTGVLGCLPDRLGSDTLNGNASFAATLTSTEFLRIAFAGTPLAAVGPTFALGSVYGPDTYSNFTNPTDLRTVNIDSLPRFKTDEKQVLINIAHDFGKFALKLDGGYTEGGTDSTVDYNLAIENNYATNPGLNTFNAVAGSGALGPGFLAARNALIPSGNTSSVCQSLAEETGTGVYGGHSVCAPRSLDFDRSTGSGNQAFGEGIFTSKFDGAFNFLVGGGYLRYNTDENSYYVNSFALDYASALFGGGTGYSATPAYRNLSQNYRLRSYGIFGEVYVNFADNVKLTLGGRYNHDQKHIEGRTTLLTGQVVPFNTTNVYTSPAFNYDADPARTGVQPLAINDVSFSRATGRAVLDWQVTPRNLIYISASRGYKSGGVNPPLTPVFAVSPFFGPETVNAIELGSKNTFLNGTLRLNLTGFYYQYKQLQLSRIVARTSVNDNVDADIYGVEAEAIVSPVRALVANMNFSYLHTSVKNDKLLANPQDPGGGRADAVVIKDLQNGNNCAVVSNAGVAAQSNGFVTAVNASLGLRGPVAIPGTVNTGAFSLCAVLSANATAATGVTVLNEGVTVNIRGNNLPQSPHYKASAGIQYTVPFGDFNLVPRVDLTYTGGYFGSIFNGNVNRIQGYEVINAQIQLNAPDDRFYVRGFVQNLTKNNAITGLYVTDQSSGLFTNAFTLEPRRYGVAAGFRF